MKIEEKILVIIPCYNEEENIERVIQDITKYLDIYDYVFINDCSTDSTAQVLNSKGYSHIDLPVNLGLNGAVQTGYKYAYIKGYAAAIQFDGDGQHQAKYISRMIDEIKDGVDIVIGSRFLTKRKDFSLRMLGSRVLTLLIKLTTKQKISDPTSGMRMLNRKMLKEYGFSMNFKPEPDSLALEINRGALVKEIQVDMNDRVAGISLYSGMYNSIKYMTKMIISILIINKWR
jgi:glycosyltransferase involved in cell wall biosynthesis